MAKKTSKKSSRKKVTEAADYEVTVTDKTIGANKPKTTTTVSATDAKQAVDTAIDPRDTGAAEEVVVRKKGPGVTPAVPQAGVVQEEDVAKVSLKAITESVSYPYTVVLPKGFNKLLESLEIDAQPYWNGLMLRFDNKTQLNGALRRLNKSDDPKSSIIINGIKGSIK